MYELCAQPWIQRLRGETGMLFCPVGVCGSEGAVDMNLGHTYQCLCWRDVGTCCPSQREERRISDVGEM